MPDCLRAAACRVRPARGSDDLRERVAEPDHEVSAGTGLDHRDLARREPVDPVARRGLAEETAVVLLSGGAAAGERSEGRRVDAGGDAGRVGVGADEGQQFGDIARLIGEEALVAQIEESRRAGGGGEARLGRAGPGVGELDQIIVTDAAGREIVGGVGSLSRVMRRLVR